MGKLKLDITSNSLNNNNTTLDVMGIVNITFDGIKLIEELQLTTTVSTLDFDVDLSTGTHTIEFELLNAIAYDVDGDNLYNSEEDQFLQVIVSSISISQDDINYISMLPAYTIPKYEYGTHILLDNNGILMVQSSELTQINVWGSNNNNTTFTFNV